MASFDIIKNLFSNSKKEEINKASEPNSKLRSYARPSDIDMLQQDNSLGWGIFDTMVSPAELFQLSKLSDVILSVQTTLRNQMFRKGFLVDNLQTYDVDYEWQKIQELIHCANLNDQTLKEVFIELEDDLNTIDDAYLLARKNYFLNSDNEIIGSEVIEFIRIHPQNIKIVFDKTSTLGNDKNGEPLYFDIETRQLAEGPVNKYGVKNLRACYKVDSFNSENKNMYYSSDEIIHFSKYKPSKTYGFSPIYSLYNKVITLINMDYYIKQYYSGDKVPKGMLTVNTSNAASFNTWWDKFLAKVRKNPHSLNPLIHQTANGNDPIKWIDFMRNLQEMQYTDVRNEIRSNIGSVFHVQPIFQNDVSTGGGLNNEGLQLTVTNQGLELGQSIYNEKVLPWIQKQLGITNYKITVAPSEEQDVIHQKDIRIKELEIAKRTAELGIKTTMNESGEFSYSEGVVEIQNPVDDMTPILNMSKSITNDIKKADTVPKKDIKEVENTLIKELEKLLSKFDLKTRPSKEALDKKINETVKNFDKIIQSKSNTKLKEIYKKAMIDLGKELNEDFEITKKDENIIEALKKQPVYTNSFKDMSKNLSNKLKEVVTKAYDDPKGWSINKIVEEMYDVAQSTESKLKTIARTETTKISAASRKTQYDKTGATYKYFHIGPNDNRTTNMSKEVVELTKNGVSWDEYVDIISKVSKKYNPKWTVNKEAPITHPNTRHIFIAKRVE